MCLLWSYWLVQRSVSGSSDIDGTGKREFYYPRIVGAVVGAAIEVGLLYVSVDIARSERKSARSLDERLADQKAQIECLKVLKAPEKCSFVGPKK